MTAHFIHNLKTIPVEGQPMIARISNSLHGRPTDYFAESGPGFKSTDVQNFLLTVLGSSHLENQKTSEQMSTTMKRQ